MKYPLLLRSLVREKEDEEKEMILKEIKQFAKNNPIVLRGINGAHNDKKTVIELTLAIEGVITEKSLRYFRQHRENIPELNSVWILQQK
jgi:hypothetical protein